MLCPFLLKPRRESPLIGLQGAINASLSKLIKPRSRNWLYSMLFEVTLVMALS